MECFLRGAKFLAKILRGLKISRKILRGLKISRKILRGLKIFSSEKNKGCETIRGAKFSMPEMIRGMKFSSARENKVYEILQCQRALLNLTSPRRLRKPSGTGHF